MRRRGRRPLSDELALSSSSMAMVLREAKEGKLGGVFVAGCCYSPGEKSSTLFGDVPAVIGEPHCQGFGNGGKGRPSMRDDRSPPFLAAAGESSCRDSTASPWKGAGDAAKTKDCCLLLGCTSKGSARAVALW